MSAQIIPFISAAVLLTLAPGPDIIYVLTQGLTRGKKSGIITALGLVSGIIVHTTLVAFGLALLVKENPILFYIIKIFGAFYLFYLAYQTYKSPATLQIPSKVVPNKQKFELYKQGLIMNLINPKVIIFFLAFFPGFLWDPQNHVITQFYILGAIFLGQALLIFTLMAVLAGTISSHLRHNVKIVSLFKWMQILVFIGIGAFILI